MDIDRFKEIVPFLLFAFADRKRIEVEARVKELKKILEYPDGLKNLDDFSEKVEFIINEMPDNLVFTDKTTVMHVANRQPILQ
jgi:hypothetical protein